MTTSGATARKKNSVAIKRGTLCESARDARLINVIRLLCVARIRMCDTWISSGIKRHTCISLTTFIFRLIQTLEFIVRK